MPKTQLRGVVPANVSTEKADEGTKWSKPSLSDFTDKGWVDLDEQEKTHIAGHFAWAKEMPPDTFGDLKLPHHRASDGAVVIAGVEAAAARLDQADLGDDEDKVKAHLEAHYHAFGKKAPWEEEDAGKKHAPPGVTRDPADGDGDEDDDEDEDGKENEDDDEEDDERSAQALPRKPDAALRDALRAAFPKGAQVLLTRVVALKVEKPKRRTKGKEAPDPEQEDLLGGGGARTDANQIPIPIAMSSEAPVLRYDWWEDELFYEVLDHAPSSVDLTYARDGLPYMLDHETWNSDKQHGIIEDVSVQKKQLHGNLTLSRAARSQEIGQDIRDGIRKKVSIGYMLGNAYEQSDTDGSEIPTRRYTAWMPVETSGVAVPADYSVGYGRAFGSPGAAAMPALPPKARKVVEDFLASRSQRSAIPTPTASPSQSNQPAPKAQPQERSMPEGTPASNGAAPGTTASVEVREFNERAGQRVKNITALASQHGCQDRLSKWLEEGTTEDAVRTQILEALKDRLSKPIDQSARLDIPERDKRRFNIARALMMNTDLVKEAGRAIDFGFEQELMQEALRKQGSFTTGKGGAILPFGMFGGRAGIDSGTSTTGAPFKFTQPGEFIPVLRNKTSVIRAGATVLDGLTGPVTFPKQTAAAGSVWSAENPGSDISITNMLTTTMTLSFKSVAAGTAFSRQMLFTAASGNYQIESMIESDIMAVVGLAIDLAALNGLGSSNQPKGILQNTNIGSVTLGTNGGAVTYASILQLEQLIGDANAEGSRMAYLTNTYQRKQCKNTAVLASTAAAIPLWTGPVQSNVPYGEQPLDNQGQYPMDGQMNGYRAIASNQVPRNLTKGTSTTVCSAILFGAWEHLIIGMFGGGFETVVDPYSKKFQGMIEVVTWAFMDVNDRYDGAFAAIQDAL